MQVLLAKRLHADVDAYYGNGISFRIIDRFKACAENSVHCTGDRRGDRLVAAAVLHIGTVQNIDQAKRVIACIGIDESAEDAFLDGLQIDIFDVHILRELNQEFIDIVVGEKQITLHQIIPDQGFILLLDRLSADLLIFAVMCSVKKEPDPCAVDRVADCLCNISREILVELVGRAGMFPIACQDGKAGTGEDQNNDQQV